MISSSLYIGKITNTKINVLYIDSICKSSLVKNVINKLNNINIDGIVDSSYLKQVFENNKVFPTVMITERPDNTVMALLEGKVIILVDNSPYALILPCFFFDFFHTTDDYYQKSFNTTFIRLIRLTAFLLALDAASVETAGASTEVMTTASAKNEAKILPFRFFILCLQII